MLSLLNFYDFKGESTASEEMLATNKGSLYSL